MEFFNDCFTQEQIEKYNNIVSGLRSKINEKRQKAESKNNLPFFKTLFKQILSERKTQKTKQSSFIEITNDSEVFNVLQKFIDENEKQFPLAKKLFNAFIEDQLSSAKEGEHNFDISNIYISGQSINTISNKWFADWNTIRSLFIEKNKKKLPEFVSLREIKEKLRGIENIKEKEDFFRGEFRELYNNENDYFKILLKIWWKKFEKCFIGNNEKGKNKIVGYNKALANAKKMIKNDKKYTNKKDFCKDKKGTLILNDKGEKEQREVQKDEIRIYAESALAIYQMMKYFSLENRQERNWNTEKMDEDGAFYNPFIEYFQNSHTWQYFNVFRNYLTRKPYSEDKIKLNFENGTLLDGWSKDKESENLGIIMRKNGKYFLGLMHKNYNFIFSEKNIKKQTRGNNANTYEKVIYEFFKDATTMIPKCSTQLNCVKDHFAASDNYIVLSGNKFIKPLTISKRIFELNNVKFLKTNITKKANEKKDEGVKMFQKEYLILSGNSKAYKTALVEWIDFCKMFLESYKNTSVFDYSKLSDSKNYESLDKFYNDVNKYIYKISFTNISEKYINEKIEKGELYLFKIYNKDFAEKSKKENKSKNLHTLYWEEIFFDENLKNPIIKLNGQAEIFFRKASMKKEIKEKKKSHDIIKNKRYTENKIFFHCPLTFNFTKNELKKDKEKYKGKADSFSIKARKYLLNNKDMNIIGIDRGEKHLAYYSVVNQNGDIIDIGSFNKIGDTDYHQKLDDLEKGKAKARLTWQTIGQIREMKKGYISQVVKKICDLMVKHNTIVVFEDLSVGFKRGRFAIEKQVYQNLELALAKKLNYLVFKNKNRGENGHYAKALQLTPQINNFKDIYRQCGFMFYIPASYTSAICPICGFRKNIPTPTENKEKNKKYLGKFDIFYEKENDRFRFAYKLSNIVGGKNKKEKNSGFRLFENDELKNDFVFYSDVERLQFQRNKDNRGGEMKWKYPNQELKDIFKKNKVDICGDINKQIQKSDFEDKNFYAPVIYNIRLILQLRNAITKKDNEGNTLESHDFILCPSCGFHSENKLMGLEKRYKGENKFEFNGDANGAYNIARKGGLVLKKISEFVKKYKDPSLMQNQDITITQEEWDKYAMKK